MVFIMSCLYFLFILLPWILLPPAGSPTPVALCSPFMVHEFYCWYPLHYHHHGPLPRAVILNLLVATPKRS